MRYLTTLIIIPLLSWTAYSQPTGIPLETKKEIVKTLESYPIVLQELNIANALIENQKSVINNLELQIEQHKALESNLTNQVVNLKEQGGLHEKELKRLRRKNNKTLILGMLVITSVVLVK